MFSQPYRGKAVDDFVAGLKIYDKIYDPNIHFGRCISIIQSSGTRKSRLVRELGGKVRHIYIVSRRLLSWTD
jgi:hypothetical protein